MQYWENFCPQATRTQNLEGEQEEGKLATEKRGTPSAASSLTVPKLEESGAFPLVGAKIHYAVPIGKEPFRFWRVPPWALS